MTKTVCTFAGVPLLILANFYLRHTLEHAGLYLYDFLDRWYADGAKVVFGGSQPWWTVLLPLKEFQGSWSATSLVLTPVVSSWIGGLLVVSFATSWAVFRSRIFSYTLAFCMAFGTQLYHTYSVSGGIALVLLPVYFELLLFFAYRIVVATDAALKWRFALAAMVPLTALSYEDWVDMVVFVALAVPLLALALWCVRRTTDTKRLLVLAGMLTGVGLAYIYISTIFGATYEARRRTR